MRKAGSPGRAGPVLDLGPDVELAHLVEQCRARYAKEFCGLLNAARACEHLTDVVALGPIADFRERRERGSAQRRGLGRKERFHSDPRGMRERHRPLDPVAQLPHIAGPGILEQSLLGCRREAVDVAAKSLRKLSYELLGEQQDVIGPIAKRGNDDRDYIDPIEKIPAEAALGGGGFEV